MEQICFLTSTREREATFSKWSCSVGAGAGYDCVTTYFNGRDDNLRVVKSCVAGGGQIYPPGTYNLDPDQQAPLAFYFFEERTFDEQVAVNASVIGSNAEPDAARWRRSTRQVRLSPAPPAPARGPAYSPAPRTDPARACRQEPRLFPLLTLARSSIDRHRGHPHKSAAQRTAGAPTPMNLGVGTGPKGCARKRKYTSTP